MSVWKPTEGLRRAADIMIEIEAAIRECGAVIPYPQLNMVRYRVTDLIAGAIEQALEDRADQEAIKAMVAGNGHADHTPVSAGAQRWWEAEAAMDEKVAVGAVRAWEPVVHVPPTADPVGLDMPDFPAPAPSDYTIADAGAPYQGTSMIARAALKPEGMPVSEHAQSAIMPLLPSAKPKRGRPKGSTNKAKKKAKAAKAKAAPVDAPAAAEAEAPAGEAAS